MPRKSARPRKASMPPAQKYPDIPSGHPLKAFSKGQFYDAAGKMFELMVAAAITGKASQLIPGVKVIKNYKAEQQNAIRIYNQILATGLPKNDPILSFFLEYLKKMEKTALEVGETIAREQKDGLEKLFKKNIVYSDANIRTLLGDSGTDKIGDIKIEPHTFELKYYSSPTIKYITGSALNLFTNNKTSFQEYVQNATSPNKYWDVNDKSPKGDPAWVRRLSTSAVVGYFNQKIIPEYGSAGDVFQALLRKGADSFAGPKDLIVGWSSTRQGTYTRINLNLIAESISKDASIKNLTAGISFYSGLGANIGKVLASDSLAPGLQAVAEDPIHPFPSLEVIGYLNLRAEAYTKS